MKKQTIRIENRIPFAELGKAIGTTDKEYKAHMGTGFAVKKQRWQGGNTDR